MKITQKRIKEIIREELQGLNEGKKSRSLSDDVKTFKKEYAIKSGKLKEKATKLQGLPTNRYSGACRTAVCLAHRSPLQPGYLNANRSRSNVIFQSPRAK